MDGRPQVLDDIRDVALLVSYWYVVNGKGWRSIEHALSKQWPVFLDSGAFSAYTRGVTIRNQDYIDFCLQHRQLFHQIASLDVIGDWKTTSTNHAEMQEAGISTIPTFHVREPFEALQALCSKNDYVALGVAGLQTEWSYRQKLWPWLTRCFQLARKVNPECKMHGFALTDWKTMLSFPWESTDSTTWLNACIYGEAIVRSGYRLVRISRQKQKNLREHGKQVRALLPSRNDKTENYDALLRHNASTLLEWVRLVKNRQQEMGACSP